MSRRNSYADYYSYTSEAFQPLRHNPAPKGAKRTKNTRKSKLRYRDVGQTSRIFSPLSIITLVIMFAAAIGIVMSSALIVERQHTIRALTSELRQIEEDNNLIRTQISLSYDIREIERVASQRLMMGRPQPHQIVHIYVPRTSQTITNIEHAPQSSGRSIWDVLSNWR